MTMLRSNDRRGTRAASDLRRLAPRPGRVAGPSVLAAVVAALAAVALAATLGAAIAGAAGPPFPSPVPGQRVYDTAGAFDPATVARAEAIIAGIEQRTGAQVAVYTQPVDPSVTTAEAESQAQALMDQWGVGRKGFDDGLVILYDLYPGGCHGQVELYAGAGFRSTFLTDAERQAIYEDDMLPYLRSCQLGQSLLVALEQVDASATPEHAATLDRARIIDALVGLILAPILFLLLLAWVVAAWLRHGRDPVYLDDPSIHIPAPPPGLTPATGALVFDGRSSRRTLTTALLDLASRAELTFEQEETGLLVKQKKMAIAIGGPAPDAPPDESALSKARRAPLGPAESYALDELRSMAASSGDRIEPERIAEFAARVPGFDDRLEANAVANGWFAEKPTAASRRWYLRGGVEVGLGGLAVFGGLSIPLNGLLFLGIAALAAGIVTLVLAYSMPARTLPGAMIRAMLAAYRRTLDKTMAQARSMGQVVQEAALPWLETPDQAVVWATALGLTDAVEHVLERSLEDVREGRVLPSAVYAPAWYVPVGASSGGSSGWFGGGQFSSSPIPNVAGMMAAIGTIGAPAGGGGGGGFGGGGGGGGGGAGGGF